MRNSYKITTGVGGRSHTLVLIPSLAYNKLWKLQSTQPILFVQELREDKVTRARSIEPKGHFIAWLALSRVPFHAVGVLPFILGMVIVWSQGYPFIWGVGILSTLAMILVMLTTYYAGEYYDYETDSLNKEYNKFSGGTRVLQRGLISKRRVLLVAFLALAAAGVIGLVLQFYFKTGPFTIPLGLFGMLCGYFYTSQPIRWAYRGVGEILIGICYGWLTVNTAYYLQTGTFGLIPMLASIPIGISIFLVILINEFPDYTSDRASGKNNLVVRLGQEKAALLYTILAAICFISIVLGILGGIPWLMAILSVIPLALIVRNILALRKQGYKERQALEKICATTFFLNLGTTCLYILAFAVRI